MNKQEKLVRGESLLLMGMGYSEWFLAFMLIFLPHLFFHSHSKQLYFMEFVKFQPIKGSNKNLVRYAHTVGKVHSEFSIVRKASFNT
jgi:hypothetical protein